MKRAGTLSPLGSPKFTQFWGRLIRKENTETSFRHHASFSVFSFTATPPRPQEQWTCFWQRASCFESFEGILSTRGPRQPHFLISGVCTICCLEGESSPDESEGSSAESLAVVSRQRLQIGGLWARLGLQMVCCGSALSFCCVS